MMRGVAVAVPGDALPDVTYLIPAHDIEPIAFGVDEPVLEEVDAQIAGQQPANAVDDNDDRQHHKHIDDVADVVDHDSEQNIGDERDDGEANDGKRVGDCRSKDCVQFPKLVASHLLSNVRRQLLRYARRWVWRLLHRHFSFLSVIIPIHREKRSGLPDPSSVAIMDEFIDRGISLWAGANMVYFQ